MMEESSSDGVSIQTIGTSYIAKAFTPPSYITIKVVHVDENNNYDATQSPANSQFKIEYKNPNDSNWTVYSECVNVIEKQDLSGQKYGEYILPAGILQHNASVRITELADDNSICVSSEDGCIVIDAVEDGNNLITFTNKPKCHDIFKDVLIDSWYYNAVNWAYENGITSGTSANTFSPNMKCTRAQAVTLLWRAAGSTMPDTTENPFDDINEESYYYKAVLWAAENGITTGTSDSTFSPSDICTRAQIVTFLYRFAGSPVIDELDIPFDDVPSNSYFYEAVKWAATNGITTGTSKTTFSPYVVCTRAQIVTFLYRLCNK
jgi:hypothetical protein